MKAQVDSRRKKMYEHIRLWQSSKLRQKEYCKEAGLSYSCFKYWKRKYYTEHNILIKNTDLPKVPDTGFIPITISDQSTKVSDIIIQYPNGVSIACQHEISSENLATLIHLY